MKGRSPSPSGTPPTPSTSSRPTSPTPRPIAGVEKYEDRFIDREISWVRFNQRVLELAEDPTLPLLERARFLAIFASNLDEFFMVRVAGLKRRIAAGVAVRAASGLMPREQLETLWTEGRALMERHARALVDLLPELGGHGIEIVRWAELDREEQKICKKLFKDRIFPVLTPLAVDPAHPFPYISGLSLNLAVVVRHPQTGTEHFARVKVPPTFGRFVGVGNQRFVPIEDVIGEHLKKLFTGMDVLASHTFRVTRNEDLEVEEDDAENLLKALEKELQRRRFGPPVRLEVEESMDPKVLELLVSELGVGRDEVVSLPGPLDLTGLHSIADLPRDDLKYAAFLPSTHPSLAEVESSSPVDVFDSVSRHDVLLHHPYDSFATSVQRFLEQAAADPHVLAIKQTLYRTSGDSPIIEALIDAAEAGKQVLVIVEIKARFDEQANIRWARKLEQAGCHVVYGLVGLKTHCKLSMVVRDEPEGIRRYVHLGTGNYNPKTARAVRGPRPADGQPRDRRGRRAALQQPLGRQPQPHLRPPPRRAPQRARGPDRPDPPGDRPPPGRPARRDPDQGELGGRRGGDRRALPRLAGGRTHRAAHPRHLRDATRRTRAVRDRPGALDPGSLPRAQPDLLVRQRRRPGRVDRVGRHDAPQPRPPRGGARTPARPARRRRRSARCSTWRSTRGRRRGSSGRTASGGCTAASGTCRTS